MKIMVILLGQIGLILMIRSEVCEDIRLITHKRVFRHKPKKKIPFIRRFLLLNYIDVLKKKWMWHYICFILEIPFSILAVVVLVISEIWLKNRVAEILFLILLLISIMLVAVPCLSVAFSRGMHVKSTRRKK